MFIMSKLPQSCYHLSMSSGHQEPSVGFIKIRVMPFLIIKPVSEQTMRLTYCSPNRHVQQLLSKKHAREPRQDLHLQKPSKERFCMSMFCFLANIFTLSYDSIMYIYSDNQVISLPSYLADNCYSLCLAMLNENILVLYEERCMCHFSAVPGKEARITGKPTAKAYSVLIKPQILIFSFNISEVIYLM